jgi:hypothetical protein
VNAANPGLKLAPAWLRRVAKSRHADRLILRGSLLTQQWIPERPAADVDHVLVPDGTPAEARAIVDEILATPDAEALPPPTHEVIWANTQWPGHRSKLGELQVDIGSGDPLAIPPRRVEIFGVSLLAVRPETMFGWKVHGLVELGHGQWKAKDLYDVHLLATHCALDEAAVIASIKLAFASRDYALSLLDRFLYTDQWGRTRGSRRKWDAWRRKWKGPTLPPENLADVAASVRERIRPLVEAAR